MQSAPRISVMENPLLDISVEFEDNAMLDKYKLVHGQACLASDEQMPLYDEMWNHPKRELIPGGSALNSARAVNFALKQQGQAVPVHYYGSIGHCEKGKMLEEILNNEGVNHHFHKDAETPTGTCAVVVVKKERALCANLAAACKYQISHYHEHKDDIATSSLIYSTAFFITSNKEALGALGALSASGNIPFAFNLSAVFLIQFELKDVLQAITHADFVFCNEDEAAAFATSQGKEGADL